MELFIYALITLAALIAFAWAILKMLRTYYNIKEMQSPTETTDITKKQQGIVYNKKDKKLEADQTIITPF